MRPVKNKHDHEEIGNLRPIDIVDLRDVGLLASAPEENGHKLMTFQVVSNGTLVPVA